MVKYTLETKLKLIKLIEEQKYSVYAAAKELEVNLTSAKRWRVMYEYHGQEGLARKNKTLQNTRFARNHELW